MKNSINDHFHGPKSINGLHINGVGVRVGWGLGGVGVVRQGQ